MKKNLFFKLGLFCAALVLVATCFITNAWAKYTKTVTATDTATVAKFVVDFKNGADKIEDAQPIDIFTTQLEHIKKDGTNNTVEGKKLIAPGSNGSFHVTITNNSEVSIKATVACELTNASNVPLVFCVDDKDGEYKTAADAFNDISVTLNVNEDVKEKTYTIYWKWVFEGGNDAFDTSLGETVTDITVTATIKLTAEQVIPA